MTKKDFIRSGTIRSNFGEVSEAIFLNSGFCYDSAETAESRFNGEAPGYVYSRYLNPTNKMLENKLVELEDGGEAACAVASGMAAVFASMMCQLHAGDHIIANKVLFGSCHYIITQILPRYGISYTLVDGANKDEWEAAFQKKTKLVFVETPANPTLTLTDIEFVSSLCKKHGAFFIVDNIFATALYQTPLELGADAVVYSTTKHIDGQGRTLGGAVIGTDKFINETLLPFHRHTGPALSPFNAWVILKSIDTFDLRMERHCDNAEKIADLLAQHQSVAEIYYPHHVSFPQYSLARKQMKRGSNLIAFSLLGGKKSAFNFMNHLNIVDISNNLGDAKSLITHPATTTHSNISEDERNEIGIDDGLVRLSVGLENIDSLLEDIENALKVA